MKTVLALLLAVAMPLPAMAAVEPDAKAMPPEETLRPVLMEEFLVTAKGVDLLVIWIRPQSKYGRDEPLVVDRILVRSVARGSLFHRNGLRTDMEIRAINGVPVRGLSEQDYEQLMRQPVPAVTFTVSGFLGRSRVLTVPVPPARRKGREPRQG